MRKFKRSTHTIVTTSLLALIIFYLIRMFQIEYVARNLFGDNLTPDAEKLWSWCLFFFGVWAISMFTIPPDFKYFVKIGNDYIIFELDEEDHRRVDKSFTISSKNWHYIVLDDGFSRIRIAYNKEVLQFLNEIKN